MTRSLITGGAGLIGSHLAETLLGRGEEVYVIDDLSTGRRGNIAHLEDHPGFTFTMDDILTSSELEDQVAAADQVYHLAAAVGVKLVMDQPVKTLITNVRGTERILKFAATHDTRVFFASTSEVYGKTLDKNGDLKALHEAHDRTLGPTTRKRWSYACSKAFDEFLALAYAEERDLSVVIVRFFNTVGPRQTGRYGMVIPRFVENALKDKPLIVYGDGQQSRSFLHVQDAVRAVVDLMDTSSAENRVFNVGHGDSITINELAERVIELTDSESDIRYLSYDEAYGRGYEDMRARTPDTTRLRQVTGFEPKYDIDEILLSVIEYMRSGASEPLTPA